jgi:hypothetical protein
MRVATLAPVAVGLVRLQGAPALVVAKVTYALERGTAVLLPDPQPISLDRWSKRGTGELIYASDLTPAKAGVDFLIVGHAKADRPRREIEVTASLGDFELSLLATDSSATQQIPLTPEHLRRHGSESRPARTAPKRVRHAGATIAGAPPSAFNVAPDEHRLAAYSGGKLRMQGLIGDGDPVEVRMPRDEPGIALGATDGSLPMLTIPMRCDTIWIDANAAEILLVFRGLLPPELPDSPYLVATLGAPTEVPPYDFLMKFPKLAAWNEATEADAEVEVEVPPSLRLPDDDDDDDDEDDEDGLLSTAIRDGRTLRAQASELLAQAAADSTRDRVSTVVIEDDDEVNAARAAAKSARARQDSDEMTQIMADRHAPEPAPDSTRVGPPGSMRLSAAERRELEEAGTMVGSVGRDLAPPESTPGPPMSAREPPTRSMVEYAQMVARLEQSTNPAYILRQHNLTTDDWKQLQRAWNRLSRDDPKVARALRRALGDARSKTK